MDGGRAGGEDSENQEEMEATESESGEGEVAGLGMGSSLSQSVGVSQQPGPSGLHFSPHSLSSSLGGPNFTSPPPQPGPSRPPQDVFAVSESQDVLGGGALQQLNFDPLPSPLQPSTPPSNQSLSPSPTRQEPRQQVVPPATRHVVPQPPVVLHGGQPQSTQPRTHRGNDRLAHVPSISEISSSQSSDEDLRLRRPPVLPSSLLRSHSACLPVQRLDQPTSESSGTDGTDQAVVPDPERQRQAALERANRNPQAVPKAPSRLRKELRAREWLASASSSLPDSSQPSTSGVSHLTPHTHSTPHPSHPASSTTASEDPSSSNNDREPTPPMEPESAYESAESLVPEAGPSHTPQSVGNRGERGSHAPHAAGERRQSGEGAGRGGMDEDDTQPLDWTPTRDELSHRTRTQSSFRLSKGTSGQTWSSSSTSSSTVSSSLQKMRGQCTHTRASVEEAREGEIGEGGDEGETQPLDQSTSPFAKDTQSPDMVSGRRSGGDNVAETSLETVPSTPVGSVEPSLPPLVDNAAAGGVSASQDLFRDNTPPPQAATPSLDQDPSWYPSVASRQREEGEERREGGGGREGGEGGGVKRQISTDTESGSNDLQPPPPLAPPPRKKRKLSGSGLSCLQRWEESEGRGLSHGDKDTSSGSSGSSYGSSSHSTPPSSGGSTTSSSHHSSTPQSSGTDGKGGRGEGRGGKGGKGEPSSPENSSQSPSSSSSRTETGRVGEKTEQSDSVQVSEEIESRDNVSSKYLSLSLSTAPLLDPSPGRDADRSVSIPSSLPFSSLESCIVISTPQEGENENNLSLGNVSSLSVGYGGTKEERGDEEEGLKLQIEFESQQREGEVEERGGGGGDVEMREEDEDSDATTLGGSDTECGDERASKPETTARKDSIVAAPIEKDQGHCDEHASSSSSSWRLVCSANTNTYSETKSSAGSASDHTPNPQSSSQTLHLCLSQDSLPCSQRPLVIDLPQSQCSQSSTPEDENGPTAIAHIAKTCCENSENQCRWIDTEKIEISSLMRENNSGNGVEEERNEVGGEMREEGEAELIREAWNLLQRERMSDRGSALLSPTKSQETQDEDDGEECVTGGGGEGEERRERCSEGFSLRISQSQTTPNQEKTTQTDKATTGNLAEMSGNTAPQTNRTNSNSHSAISGDLQPTNSSREAGSGTNGIRTSVVQDEARARPKPVYESIALSVSTGFLSSPLPPSSQSDQQTPHLPSSHPSHLAHSSQTPQVPSSTSSQPHGNDISQASSLSAGTPFQFQLPQNAGLLIPHQYTSPPSLHTPLTPSSSPPHPSTAITHGESAKKKNPVSQDVQNGQQTHHPSQSTDESSKKKKQRTLSRGSDKSKEKEKGKDTASLSNGDEPSLVGRRESRKASSSTSLRLKKFYGGNEGREPARSSERPRGPVQTQLEQEKEHTAGGSRAGGGRGGFVLVGATTPRDEEVIGEDDSQNELEINIPGDSQFETSADSQRLLDCPIEPPSVPAPSAPRGPICQTPPPSVRSNIPSSTQQSWTVLPPRPQTSIFSNVLTSRRKTVDRANETVGNGNSGGRDDDPFHFDSESHGQPAEFILRRKRRWRDDDCKGMEGGEEENSNGVSTVRNDSPQVESSETNKTNSTPPSAPVITSSLSPSSQPHSSTPSHPPPLPPHQPTIAGPFPQTPVSHTFTPSPHHFHLTPTLTPASSVPLYSSSHLPFTSPASRVTEEDLSSTSRSYRGRRDRFSLRHTHTYRHVVEVKIVSQEVYEGDRLVEGLNTVWQEQSVVSSSPLERVDVHPYTSSSSSPSHTLPIPVLPTTLTPRNLHHQTPNPPPPPTTTVPVIIPVREESDCAPPSMNGGRESRETESAGETEEEMEEEPVVSERNEIQNQTASTIQQTPQRRRQTRRPTALHTTPSSFSSALPGQRTTRTTSASSSSSVSSALPGQRTTRTTSASSSTAIVTRRGTPSRKGAVNGEGGETGEMCEGSLVIARWRNHSWYPAIVTGSKNGRLNVKFADGDKSSVSLSHAFPRSQLKRGMLVIAMDDTREGQRGHFSGFTGPTLSDWYMSPLTGGDGVQRVRFVCDQLEVPPATALLCVGGKHTRGVKRFPSEVVVSPAPKKRCLQPAEGEEEEEGWEEDSQPSNSQRSLFEGLSFLLTMRRKEDRHLATPPSEQFNKDKIASQIRSRMGRVLDSVDQKLTGSSGCFVLSDSYCKTQKYLVGLALGLPCISYCWISQCIEKGELVDHTPHLLPAGQKSGEGEVVLWAPRPPGAIMAGISLTVEGTRDFKDNWRVIARKAGATVKDAGGHGVVTVSESGRCLQTRARCPRTLVKSDWLTQSLITGTRLDWGSFVWINSGSQD